MKTHLIVFYSPHITRDALVKLLDQMPEVTFWYYCMPASVFVTSPLNAHDLEQKIEEKIRLDGVMFIVAEIEGGKTQGRLPDQGWQIVNYPDSPALPPKKKRL